MSELNNLLNTYNTIIITKIGCPYCEMALEELKNRNIEYKEFNKDENKEVVAEVKEKYNWMTYPMIFIDGKFIGGCEELVKLSD